MAELIHQHSVHIRTREGTEFRAQTYAERQPDGTWTGWLEFTPVDGKGPVLRTERETTQPNREAVEYWAGGLEPVYFEGAFVRAQPIGQLAGRHALPHQ
jgi:hypothetical protein